MRSRAALVLVLLSASSIVTPAQRLTRAVVPDHYDIHLSPDFTTDTFAGEVEIRVRLSQQAHSITLNAAEIDVRDASIAAGGTTQKADVALDADRETATLTVAKPLPSGAASIHIRFTGRLNDQLRGFYLSRANGREYAITQLEATDARRAFPSFDDPSMKATFAVAATIDTRDTAISNGRLLSDTPGPASGKHTLRFATTKPMSPYLVALAVGDWECIGANSGGIPVRVCGTPNRKDQLEFALEAADFALRYFNRLFTTKYPFEKLDIVAVPDFSAGAMENTGAIVFREQFLVVEKDGGTTERRKQIAQFIAHEIAHQWFGDLVTMAWWDDIWLNEGFATWMERRPMQEWKPEWHAALDEVRDTQGAMDLDGLRATRPVRTNVDTPQEINQVFDAIAYQKTAGVVRMVEGFVGAGAYREGINAYLRKFAYGNATGEGFWSTLAAVTKKPIDRVLQSFITQSSMPLVTVDTRCTGNTTELLLSQRPMSEAAPASTLWEIPVCYKRERNGKLQPQSCRLLSTNTLTVKLDGCSSWVFANVDSRGYYRTSYNGDDLRALGKAVANNQLNPLEQTALLSDVWALVQSRNQNIADYLALSNQLVNSALSPVMTTALYRINYISEWLVDADQRPVFAAWVRQAVAPIAKRLGWTPRPDESDDIRSLRAIAMFTMGNAGRDADILREARRLAGLHVTGAEPLHPSMVDTALELAAIEGDAALYDQYMSRMRASSTPADQAQYLAALSFFTDTELQKRTLAYATSLDIRTQDTPTLIRYLLQRPWAADATWAHVKNNWDRIVHALGIFQGIPYVLGSLQNFCDGNTKNDIEQFFAMHPVAGADRTIRQSLETIHRCTATKAAQSKNLANFLAQPQPLALSPKP